MGLLDHFEKLINEHGSAAILREHLALVKAEQTALERKNADLQSEKQAQNAVIKQQQMRISELETALDALQTGIHSGFVCDHCGSPKLNRVGNRTDPTFGVLGVKQAIFLCLSCGKQSAFTQEQ